MTIGTYFTCAKASNKRPNDVSYGQTALPWPIPRNSVESDHKCTSRIYFDNLGDNATLTLYNVMVTSQLPC